VRQPTILLTRTLILASINSSISGGGAVDGVITRTILGGLELTP
jgi:hypothetical protein